MLVIILLLAAPPGLRAQKRCESDVCLNGGTCRVNDVDRSFQCICPHGFGGLLCEHSENICSLKCQNNGQCVFTDAGKQRCNCSKGDVTLVAEALIRSCTDGEEIDETSTNEYTKSCWRRNNRLPLSYQKTNLSVVVAEFSGEFCEIGSIDCQVQGCAAGERCVITDSRTSYCAPDPCLTNPCQHGSTCIPVKKSFECACSSGYEGELCAEDIDECASSPCKNQATCINTLGSFTCLCKDGFQGILCEESTPCHPNPCYNEGICSEQDGVIHCTCKPGFTSQLCQVRIEEGCNCKSEKQICVNGICKCPAGFMGKECDQPLPWSCMRDGGCENGGTCVQSTGGCLCAPGFTGMHCEHMLECTVDGKPCVHGSCIWSTNGTMCRCQHGFEGENCEKNVLETDPCSQKNCNAGRCESKGGIAVCLCSQGFTGEFCERTAVCDMEPCKNNGKCIVDPANPLNFKCLCDDDYGGTYCELMTNESKCTPDCAAGERCEARNGTFVCLKDRISCDECEHSIRCVENREYAVCVCDTSWTGTKCDQRIEACESISCKDYQICRNERTSVGTVAYCGCAPGLIGSECTVNTAVTFHETSFFLYQSTNNIVRSPTSNYTLKFTFRSTLENANILSTEDILSRVQFALSIRSGYLYGNFTGFIHRKLLPFAVNDDRWYTVLLNNTNKVVSVEIREGDFVLTRLQMKERKNMGIYWTRIGKGRGDGFKGCIRDFFINGEFVDMLKSTSVFGVTEGCQRSKLCSPNPCQNDGVCYDQWDEFRCDCKKPFLPPYCIKKTDEVTFGHNNVTSRLEFDTGNELEDIKWETSINFLIRTNKPNGALLYLGEKNGDDVEIYLLLEVINGSLGIQTKLGGKKVYTKRAADKIDDNKVHVVNLIRKRNNFTISVDGMEKLKLDVENRFDHPLLADSLILGSTGNLPAEIFTTNDYFKGTLQDLRINNRIVPLTELPTDIANQQFGTRVKEENILKGTVSDDVCLLLKPCVNGKCSNTFNDFECDCEYPWTGKRCNEQDHCALTACGTNVTCTNYGGGYICSSPATFIPSSFANYELKGNGDNLQEIKQISFSLRTRSKSGQILYLGMPSSFISVALKDGFLVYKTSVNDSVRSRGTNTALNDGVLHNVEINRNGLFIDGKLNGKKLPPLPMDIFESIGNISLTVGERNQGSTSFDGCLQDLQIGLIPISFFDQNRAGGLLVNSTHFELIRRRNILDDQCYAEELCGSMNPCKNGAVCHDLWNKRICECEHGFSGTFCEVRVNKCENHTCRFGACVDSFDGYTCQCLPGYGGQFCDEELDLCRTMPCLNGGSCRTNLGRFNCTCQPQFVGSRCQTLRSSTCSSVPCENGGKCIEKKDAFKCVCPAGFDGALCDIQKNFCEANPCKNGATCLSKDDGFECLCTDDYEGRICADLKDHCITLPCVHGQCRTVPGSFLCDCEAGWKGERCDKDIDECMRFPCENDGNCTNTPGSFHCTCDSYHLGDRCEVEGSCMQEPCGPNGSCLQKTATTHVCVCRRGYTGDVCDIMIDYCNPDPCQNGATCQRFIGGFTCLCLDGFTGETCSEDIDDCVGEVCQNGGRCVDRINGFECDCEGTGYQGARCTEDIDECALGLCASGSCSNLIGSYSCVCNSGFIGKQCNVEDPCFPDKLNRTRHDCLHGVCINSTVILENGREVARYECDCDPGYGGQHCIRSIEKRKSIPLSYVAGPVLALIVALLIIGCVLFVIVAVRGRRAMQGTYSPSHQESSTTRMPMDSMLKTPPEERLI